LDTKPCFGASLSEKRLAQFLLRKKVKFQQQAHVGNYVVDFLVPPNIVVEAEGKVHAHRQDHDTIRTTHLESLGYRVFRVPNYMIFEDPVGVAEMIKIQFEGSSR
jgi:very-short-patch-repair endonuclease